MSLLRMKKLILNEDDFYENYETRHSTEPNKPIIMIKNLEKKINFLPKIQFSTIFNELDNTFHYNSNNLNTSKLVSHNKPLKTFFSERKISVKKVNLNRTQTVENFREKGFSFLNSLNSGKKMNSTKKKFIDPNCSFVSAKRNLNETFNFALKSHKSSENFFKRKVHL